MAAPEADHADDGGSFEIEWTSEREDILISMWEERACLYDVSSKDFRNRDRKRQAWAEIAQYFKTSGR